MEKNCDKQKAPWNRNKSVKTREIDGNEATYNLDTCHLSNSNINLTNDWFEITFYRIIWKNIFI